MILNSNFFNLHFSKRHNCDCKGLLQGFHLALAARLAFFILVNRKDDEYFPAKSKNPLESSFDLERGPPFCYELIGHGAAFQVHFWAIYSVIFHLEFATNRFKRSIDRSRKSCGSHLPAKYSFPKTLFLILQL